MAFNPFGAMFGRLGGMLGAGGHQGYGPSASAYRQTYRAYSTAILEIQRGRADGVVYGTSGRDNVNFGGKSTYWKPLDLIARSHHATVCAAGPECAGSHRID